MKTLGITVVLFFRLTLSEAQPGNNEFVPFPGDSSKLYQFNLAKNFFASEDEERKQRVDLISAFEKLNNKFQKSVPNAQNILYLIYAYDSLYKLVGKHSAYLALEGYINQSNSSFSLKLDSFDRKLSPILSRLDDKINSVKESSFKNYINHNPSLNKYNFYFQSLKTDPMNKVSAKERQLINEITPDLISWQSRLFQTTLRSIVFKLVQTPKGNLSLTSNSNEIYNHPNREVRKNGYLNNLEGLSSRKETFAFALIETIRGRNKLSRLNGYQNFPEESYSGRYLKITDVLTLLNTIADSATINKRYELAVINNIKRIGNIDTVFLWDRLMPDPKAPTPRFTISQASNIILEATKPLGTEYYDEMSKLLNPNNGRLDMVQRANRVIRPGFSTGSVGYNSTFFQGNYEGYMSDLIIFGHEAGHAVQNMLMENNKVSSFYATGPNYFTESFALLNELLITDYLYENASTVGYRKYYLSGFLDQATDLFKYTQDALFEQSLYDTIPTGKINNAEQLEMQIQKIGKQFSLWFDPSQKNEMQWVKRLQFVTNPLYRLNYVYARVLALNYFKMYKENPKKFIVGYNSLMRNGYNDGPEKLLIKFLNFQLNSKETINSALEVIRNKISEYESLTIKD